MRCGAELVDLAETYYVRVFTATAALIVAVVALTLAMMPLGAHPQRPVFTLTTLALIGGGGVLGLRRPARSYRILRRHPAAIIAGVAAVSLALAIDDPLQSALWLVAFGPLSVAVIAGDGTIAALSAGILIFGYVLGATMHGHLQALVSTPQLVLEASGYPFWALLLHGTTDGAATLMLRLGQQLSAPLPPLRVTATTVPMSSASPQADEPAAPETAIGAEVDAIDPTVDLTARELEVLALLCDGYTQKQIAPMLDIPLTQVGRRIKGAIARTGAQNKDELVAMAMAAGLVTPRKPGNTGA